MNVRELIEGKSEQRRSGPAGPRTNVTAAIPGNNFWVSSLSRGVAGACGLLARLGKPGVPGLSGPGLAERAAFPKQAAPPLPEEILSPAREEDRPVDRGKIGWVSPAYVHSLSVALDPAVLKANRCVAYLDDSPEADSYRVLRTRLLQRIREIGGNAVMVTSALPGEGKTLTAINLALTFAREFQQTVLLVDCDLRRQKIHRYLGYPCDRGLIDYLLHGTPVRDVMVWPGIEKMTVISGGRTIAESSELLGSLRMRELMDEMKQRYPDRILFLDAPPVLTGADAIALTPLVDHILFTAQAGATPVPELQKALGMLPARKVAGLVLNRQEPGRGSHYKVDG